LLRGWILVPASVAWFFGGSLIGPMAWTLIGAGTYLEARVAAPAPADGHALASGYASRSNEA